MCVLCCCSCVDSATLWTVACHASLSMEFSRQEYWSGMPCPLPGDLPNPGIKPRSPSLQEDSLPCEPPRKPKNIGVGSLSLLQGLPHPGIKPGSPALQIDSYQLSYQGSQWWPCENTVAEKFYHV